MHRYPETETPSTQGEVKIIPTDEAHQASNPLQALGIIINDINIINLIIFVINNYYL